ncbi:hypothetical protein KY290_013683 [Solanum tuberosum]|uniref:Uncharacterized protein n=1 Tax=Solanum tuberosum TaxID=4113 RepID=A0ABQ7VME3_SOLTU|nr:hypothetical protein KY289_013803 [Solanum tuberosum]KAH0769702.1 hypothetical protein KY290_013683 [Solanum tuberosum]
MEEMFQIQRDGLNSELAEEYPLHESSNLKEADADYEPDEGPGPVRMKKLIKLSLKKQSMTLRSQQAKVVQVPHQQWLQKRLLRQGPGTSSEKLLKKFHIMGAKSSDTLMGTNSKLDVDRSGLAVNDASVKCQDLFQIPRLSNEITFEGCSKNPKTIEEDKDLILFCSSGDFLIWSTRLISRSWGTKRQDSIALSSTEVENDVVYTHGKRVEGKERSGQI